MRKICLMLENDITRLTATLNNKSMSSYYKICQLGGFHGFCGVFCVHISLDDTLLHCRPLIMLTGRQLKLKTKRKEKEVKISFV